jgi:hypothetical protein
MAGLIDRFDRLGKLGIQPGGAGILVGENESTRVSLYH